MGVMGHPIGHSLSPALHNAAFRAMGLDWVSVAFPVPLAALDHALEGIRALGIKGVSVTMPLKEAAAEKVTALDPVARSLGAVNCVAVTEEGLSGHNTDGAGFLDALVRATGKRPEGWRCVVAGAGGAARAVVLALAGAGASEISVVGRTPARVERALELAGAAGRHTGSPDVTQADLVVNATPLGMAGTAFSSELPPIPAGDLGPHQVVVDLVYHPERTAWMELARARGAVVLGGLGMLVHQAARQISLWTGEDPPVEVMWQAVARGALGDPSVCR